MARITSNETPEEMRKRGRGYLELAQQTAAPDAAEALRTLAYDTYLLAAMVERGETADDPMH